MTKLTAIELARQRGVTLDYIYKQLRTGKFEGAVKEQGEWRIPLPALKTKSRRRLAKERE